MTELQNPTVLGIPLPKFRQPPADPALPTVPADSPSNGPLPARDVLERGRERLARQEKDQPSSLPPIQAPPADDRTRTSATRRTPADAKATARVIGGLLMITLTSLGVFMARRGANLRLPTVHQRDDIADPLGRIAARYLPAEFITGTLVDVTEAAAATHAYALDPEGGPLVTRSAGNVFEQE